MELHKVGEVSTPGDHEEDKLIAESLDEEKTKMFSIAAKLSDASDANAISHLFVCFRSVIMENVALKRRNHDLMTQLYLSTPNYTKMEEELEAKFEAHKTQLRQEQFQSQVLYLKLVASNESLMKENEELRAENRRLLTQIEKLEHDVTVHETKIELLERKVAARDADITMLKRVNEDITYQNYIADVFRYIRDSVIANNSSTIYPKGTDCLFHLYSIKDLEIPKDDEYEDSEEDDKNADTKEVQQKIGDWNNASTFIAALHLDPTLIRDLRTYNKTRNDDTHDEGCKLIVSKKVTAKKNQSALIELRSVLNTIGSDHASYHLKDRLLQWCDGNIKA